MLSSLPVHRHPAAEEAACEVPSDTSSPPMRYRPAEEDNVPRSAIPEPGSPHEGPGQTGRDPSDELLELADYISEVKMVRHPFEKGIRARKGIEY